MWLRNDKHSEPINPDVIRREHKDWSGQWLHWAKPDQDRAEEKVPEGVWETIQRKKSQDPERVPTYYAILMLDGDDMGKWLWGENGLALGQRLHLRLSKALTEFALNKAPTIVEKDHPGTLIYAGGDDVLALIPTRAALACAYDLQQAYRKHWAEKVGGEEATMSAGLAIVHTKEDLRFALNTARAAEKMAKEAGKDAMTVRICRRSGEHTSVSLP